MKVTIKELPADVEFHPAAANDKTNITHMIYIITDEDVEDPTGQTGPTIIKAGIASSLEEAQTIQKEFEEIVANME